MYSCTLSLTSALDGSGWPTPHLGRFTPGWTRTGLHGCGKSRLHRDSIPRTVQPVASRYTDWATPAHNRRYSSLFNKVFSPFSRTGVWNTAYRRLRQDYKSRLRKIPQERRPVEYVLRTQLRAFRLYSGGERWMNTGALVEYMIGRKIVPFPLRTPKIPHWSAWDWILTSLSRGR